jgi:hypothetical protein
MSLKNTYKYRFNKTIKDLNKLNDVHETEIKQVKDYYKSELKNILNKISSDLNIPMSTLIKYNKLLDSDITNVLNTSVDNTNVQCNGTNSVKNPDILIKTNINDQIYYVNKTTSIIYKISSDNITSQIGIIDSNGNFLLDF